MGHPILRKQAKPVRNFRSPEIQRLIEDMWDTMFVASGVGLAAPQVYEDVRVIVYHIPEPEQAESIQGVLINPTFEPITKEYEWDWEGCLSMPGLRGFVPRYRGIRYQGFTVKGTAIAGELQGFPARVLQHEIDHLEGILFIDRMTDLKDLIFEEHLTPQRVREKASNKTEENA